MITCYRRYVSDPFKLKEFEHYGKSWIPPIQMKRRTEVRAMR